MNLVSKSNDTFVELSRINKSQSESFFAFPRACETIQMSREKQPEWKMKNLIRLGYDPGKAYQ